MKKMMGMLEEKSKASPEKLKAKMEVVKELRNMMAGMMHDKMGQDREEMKKVTVAAPDEESLKQGLDKAKDIVDQMPEMSKMGDKSSEDEMCEESPEEEMDEESSDMESKIAHMEKMLQEMKDQMKMKA